MGVEFLIVLLIVFMLVAALIAVETRDLLSSVISLGAAGFALSVIDLLLGAPDLAITQVVVEVIALVMLIRVVITRTDTTSQAPRDTLRTGAVRVRSPRSKARPAARSSSVVGSLRRPLLGTAIRARPVMSDPPVRGRPARASSDNRRAHGEANG